MPGTKARSKQSWWSSLRNLRSRQKELARKRSHLKRQLQLQTLEPRQMLAADTPGETLATAYEPTLTPGVQWTYNETIGNGLYGNKDVDFYKVNLSAGQSLTVDIDTPYYGSLNSYVRLFSSSGTQVAYNDDEDGGGYGYGYGGSLDSLLSYTASSTGVYYVGVSGASNTSYNVNTAGSGIAGTTGTYTIKMLASQPPSGDVPGDTLATAYVPTLTPGTQWTYNETIGNGLHGNKDVDLYKVNLLAGQSLTIDIDTPYYSYLNSYVRLFNSYGTQVAYNDDEGGGGYGYGYGGSLDSLLNYTAPSGRLLRWCFRRIEYFLQRQHRRKRRCGNHGHVHH